MSKSNQNATVSLIRSNKANAEQITEAEIRQMVEDAVKIAGGLDFIKDGQTVVLKPNLIGTRTMTNIVQVLSMNMTNPYKRNQIPRETNGLTTDYRVTKKVVEMVRDVNPSGKVYIMECSGEGDVRKTMDHLGYNHDNIPGVDDFIPLDTVGGDYRDVDHKDFVAVSMKKNQRYEKLPDFLNNKYYYEKRYYNADVVISMPVLKNHAMAAITGAVKNVGIGCLPGQVYGMGKTNINRTGTIDHQFLPLNNFIHDFYYNRPVQFAITDGLQGLAYGPQAQGAPSYDAAKMNMRLIMASKDAVALDTVHACVVGVDPAQLPVLQDLSKEGMGIADTAKISVVGNAKVADVKKTFPGANGLIKMIFNEPHKKYYDNFNGPDFKIKDITVEDKNLLIRSTADSNTKKVDVFINDQLINSFTKGLNRLHLNLKDVVPAGNHEMTLVAHDDLMNSTVEKKAITV